MCRYGGPGPPISSFGPPSAASPASAKEAAAAPPSAAATATAAAEEAAEAAAIAAAVRQLKPEVENSLLWFEIKQKLEEAVREELQCMYTECEGAPIGGPPVGPPDKGAPVEAPDIAASVFRREDVEFVLICLGLGSPSACTDTRSCRYQLAMALLLQQLLQVSASCMHVLDPVMSALDLRILFLLFGGSCLSPLSLEKNRKKQLKDTRQTINIYFAPHCDADLYGDLFATENRISLFCSVCGNTPHCTPNQCIHPSTTDTSSNSSSSNGSSCRNNSSSNGSCSASKDREETEGPPNPKEGEGPLNPKEGEGPLNPKEGEGPLNPRGEGPPNPEEGEGGLEAKFCGFVLLGNALSSYEMRRSLFKGLLLTEVNKDKEKIATTNAAATNAAATNAGATAAGAAAADVAAAEAPAAAAAAAEAPAAAAAAAEAPAAEEGGGEVLIGGSKANDAPRPLTEASAAAASPAAAAASVCAGGCSFVQPSRGALLLLELLPFVWEQPLQQQFAAFPAAFNDLAICRLPSLKTEEERKKFIHMLLLKQEQQQEQQQQQTVKATAARKNKANNRRNKQ
ncbi:hypothetical protein, conserved [Eimeria acervulina]|uniref:SRR1-like domain-containing protein n=1 Tax=Eimeria acervulina TaxID=5801 RepID=U6GNG4_EIMAC|nr:hypothetical protein, conserved [Eimeria acervulina]CDI80139.1 hypothetical protein, conserved [Eimeria acervulina]